MRAPGKTAYEAALQDAAFLVRPQGGPLIVSGSDRLAFLQRQTTNDARLLSPRKFLFSALTSPTARILDVLALFDENEAIAALPLPGRAADTFRHLKSRIFFMDKVTINNLSEAWTQFELLGPRLADLYQATGAFPRPAPGEIIKFELGNSEAFLLNSAPPFRLGALLLVPADIQGQVEETLSYYGAMPLQAAEYQALRIEAGVPGPEGELTADYTPFEVGLSALVSESKGCYTGQEVLARQVTYDKIAQRLCGLRLDSPAGPKSRLWAGENPAGLLTSAARSPRMGWIALAVVRRQYAESGVELTIGEKPATAQRCIVSRLPF